MQCSGRIPMLSLVLGPVVGVSALATALADFTILEKNMANSSFLAETPEVMAGEVDAPGLGSAICMLHGAASPASWPTTGRCMCRAADLLSFLPDHNDAAPPFEETADASDRLTEELETIVPDNPNKPYNMVKVIETIVDDARFVQLFDAYAENIIIGFARLGGRPVGVIANQPQVLAGCLDIDASIKAARFIRTCDAFNLPLLTVEDVPGFFWRGPRMGQHHPAWRNLYAYAEATVPKMTAAAQGLRNAYLAMSCKHLAATTTSLGPRQNWPS